MDLWKAIERLGQPINDGNQHRVPELVIIQSAQAPITTAPQSVLGGVLRLEHDRGLGSKPRAQISHKPGKLGIVRCRPKLGHCLANQYRQDDRGKERFRSTRLDNPRTDVVLGSAFKAWHHETQPAAVG